MAGYDAGRRAGLAMVIEREGAAILYDTGLAWPDGDSGQQIIIPWLRWHNLRPEGVLLSHEHLDHRGGLNSLLKAWPELWIRSPLGWQGHLPCRRGESWRWRGLTFRVLWPLPDSDMTAITAPAWSVLMTESRAFC
ncbi:ComEC family competence protein [Raoultella planticola]|uniref:ComEC family competence protein n=1 Tax=Raoultella planticola TaxID=575 RepID=A0A485C9I7_RAOPL|nr:ComEC family competence protein [Raoultella planticola]